MWNACDYVLKINFKHFHIAGSINTAAHFLSRLKLKVTEKKHLKMKDDIQTTPFEVTTSSSDVANDEQFFPPKQTQRVIEKNTTSNGKNNFGKTQWNGQGTI